MSARESFARRYRDAARESVLSGGETARQRAYELGREALSEGVGLLELVGVQQDIVDDVVARPPGGAASPAVRALHAFFVESLAPFEIIHRGFRDSNRDLRRLNERLSATLESAMSRVAHLLHDQVGQVLVTAHLALDDLAHRLSITEQRRIESIREILGDIETQLRSLSRELRPTVLDDLGLLPAVEALAASFAARSGLRIAVRGSLAARAPREVETAVYRIVQESLTNVMRHARASNVLICLRLREKTLGVRIRDDGIGFESDARDPLAPGLGVIGMRERVEAMGGRFRLEGRPRKGCQVVVAIPWER